MIETKSQNESFQDLADRIARMIEERLLQGKVDDKTNKYLTRRQLSELLSVDLATLHRWSKTGKLPSYRLGGRVYYRMSDVESKMLQVPNLKDGRA